MPQTKLRVKMRMHFRVLAGAGAQPDSGIFQERISSEISRKLPFKNIAQTFRETNSSINLTQQIAVDVADVLSASQELFVSPLLFFLRRQPRRRHLLASLRRARVVAHTARGLKKAPALRHSF